MYAQGRLHGYRSHGEASNGDRYGYLPRRGRQVRRALGRAKLARLAPATWRRSQTRVVRHGVAAFSRDTQVAFQYHPVLAHLTKLSPGSDSRRLLALTRRDFGDFGRAAFA